MKKLLLIFVFSVVFSLNAFADIRLPDKIKPTPTATPQTGKKLQMNIRINSGVDEATLRIPRNALNDLRAQLDEIDSANSNAAVHHSFSNTQTLMSGLFFSAALIFGGVWIFRGKSFGKHQKIVSGLLIFAFLGASVYTVTANVAPPAYVGLRGDMFSDKMQSRYRGAVGDVKVEIVERNYEGAPIEFLVPPSREKGKNDEE